MRDNLHTGISSRRKNLGFPDRLSIFTIDSAFSTEARLVLSNCFPDSDPLKWINVHVVNLPCVYSFIFMNIFVAKLSSRTSSEDLERLFEVYGEVTSCKVIKDRDTGLSKGFGFVIMPNDDEAREAISNLDQSQVDGNTIVAKEAVPKDEWESKRGQRGSSGPRNDFRGGNSGGSDYRSGGGNDYRSGGGSDYRSGGGNDYRSGGGGGGYSGGGSDYRGGGGGYRDSGGGSDYRGGGGFRDGGYRSNDRGDRFNKGGGKRF
jgi:hypothetical protein